MLKSVTSRFGRRAVACALVAVGILAFGPMTALRGSLTLSAVVLSAEGDVFAAAGCDDLPAEAARRVSPEASWQAVREHSPACYRADAETANRARPPPLDCLIR